MEAVLGALVAVFLLAGRWSLARLNSDGEEYAQLVVQPRTWVACATVLAAALVAWYRRRHSDSLAGGSSPRDGRAFENAFRAKSHLVHHSRNLLWATLALIAYMMLTAAWAIDGRLATEKVLELFLVLSVVAATGLTWQLPGGFEFRRGFISTILLLTGFLAVVGILSIGGERGEIMGGGPNVFGRNMAFLTVIALGKYVDGNVQRAFFWISAATIALLLVVWSGSRGALLSVIAGIIAVVAVGRYQLLGRATLAIVFAGAVVVGLQESQFSQAVTEVFQRRILDQTIDQGYTSARDELYRLAWEAGRDHPWGGLGLNGFFEIHNPNYPHNLILEVFSEGGIPGLLLLSVYLFAFVQLIRSTRQQLDPGCLGLWVVAFVASQTSGDLFDSRGVFLIPFLAAVPRIAASERKRRASATREHLPEAPLPTARSSRRSGPWNGAPDALRIPVGR